MNYLAKINLIEILAIDRFADMPLSAQALYLHIAARANEEGFAVGINSIARMIGATKEDIEMLENKEFIFPVERYCEDDEGYFVHGKIEFQPR